MGDVDIVRKYVNYAPDFIRKNMAQLRTERKKRGFTLETLHYWSGINVIMLEKYEAGEHKPRRKNYNALAKVFGWRLWEMPKRPVKFTVRIPRQEHEEALEKAKLYGVTLTGLIRQLLKALPLQKS